MRSPLRGSPGSVKKMVATAPPLVFAVSACLVPGVRAQESQQTISPSVDDTDNSAGVVDNANANNNRRDRASAQQNTVNTSQGDAANRLFLPVSQLKDFESALLRQILLTHGVELDLQDPQWSGDSFADIIKKLDQERAFDQTASFEILLGGRRSTIKPETDEYFRAGVSREWDVLWLDQLPRLKQRASAALEDQLDELSDDVSREWKVTILSTRRATTEDIEQHNAFIRDKQKRASAAGTRPQAATGDNTEDALAGERLDETAGSLTGLEASPSTVQSTIGAAADPAAEPAAEPVAEQGQIKLPPDADLTPDIDLAAEPGGGDTLTEPKTPSKSAPSSGTAATPLPDITLAAPNNPNATRAESEPRKEIEGVDRDTIEQDIIDGQVNTPTIPGFSVDDSVPAGFESLAGPQTLTVDLIFNASNVGPVSVTGNSEEFVFDDPDFVVALLPDLEDPDAVGALLQLPLPSNVHLICFRDNDPPGCGVVDATPVAAIFNEDLLLVELFLAPELQSVQARNRVRYLPPPDDRTTTILSLNAVASDYEGRDSAIDISVGALAGFGSGSLEVEMDYSSRTERQRLREFRLTQHFTDTELNAGSYPLHPGGALTSFDILGVSYQSSLKTRVDLEQAFSSELVVYLPRRAVVQLVINDRVYSGISYAAGNQVLDTSSLPEGTYQLDIQIVDPITGTRTEQRLFTKSTVIPPRDQSLFRFTAGAPLQFSEERIFPEIQNDYVFNATTSRRIDDRSAYSLGLLQFGEDSFAQASYINLSQQLSFKADASVGSHNTRALSASAAWFNEDLSINLGAEWYETDNVVPDDDEVLSQFYPSDFEQFGVSINRSFKKHSVGARTTLRREDGVNNDNATNQYAVFYRRPIFRRKGMSGFFDATFQDDSIDRRLVLQTRVFFERLPFTGSLRAEASNDDRVGTEFLVGADGRWQSSQDKPIRFESGFHAERSGEKFSAGVSAGVTHPWYRADLSTDLVDNGNGSPITDTVATFAAHLGVDRQGAALGSDEFLQSGFIVDIQGEPDGALFDIVVNSVKVSTGRIGVRQFVGLQPYDTYRLQLVPHSVLSNGLGNEEFEFTLYPGHIHRVQLEAVREILLVATLVDTSGQLITDAIINRGPNPLLIGEDGFLQAELAPGESVTVKSASTGLCQFVVPDSEEEVVVLNEPLLCRPLPA